MKFYFTITLIFRENYYRDVIVKKIIDYLLNNFFHDLLVKGENNFKIEFFLLKI